MPLQKLQFRPGLTREVTTYSNEGGWFDGNKIRFRFGFPEKIGGWVQQSSYQFLGIARSLWNWIDLNGNNYIGVGTNLKYYIQGGGFYNDITPVVQTTTTGTATTVNTSKTVTITDTSYNPNVGDYFYFYNPSTAITVGGITLATAGQQVEYLSLIHISEPTRPY